MIFRTICEHRVGRGVIADVRNKCLACVMLLFVFKMSGWTKIYGGLSFKRFGAD